MIFVQAKTKVDCRCATKAAVPGPLPCWVEYAREWVQPIFFNWPEKKQNTENCGSKSDVISHAWPNNFNDLMNDVIWTKPVGFTHSRSNETKCRTTIWYKHNWSTALWIWVGIQMIQNCMFYPKFIRWETRAAFSSHSQTEEPFYVLFMLVWMTIFHSFLCFGLLYPLWPQRTGNSRSKCGNQRRPRGFLTVLNIDKHSTQQ